MHLVFLLEERSAKHVLDTLLPQFIPNDVTYSTIPHQGKSDLEKSIPIKLRGWLTPETYFVILHDKDNSDCHALKRKLTELCEAAGRKDVLVRIVCYELESWYWGDLDAVEKAYPKFRAGNYRNWRKYRVPDDIVKPSKELERLIRDFQKGAASRLIPNHMNIRSNKSKSFQIFISGVEEMILNISRTS